MLTQRTVLYLLVLTSLTFGCTRQAENVSQPTTTATQPKATEPKAAQPVVRAQPVGGAGPGCVADSCEEGELPPPAEQVSVTGAPLATCSTDPMTGWFRDGACRTDANDRGVHVVCGEMTEAFLSYTRAQGNDLSTPRGSFPGLKPGDRWCLCAARWEEARRAGAATPVVLEATNARATKLVSMEALREYAR